ncbi:VanZ family protein [Planomicrobium sp. CPCC 101079]|uniref:VanZ family protein n=1 Tax=Planomicrobium sp. CPCC 101079 TaxID=2599618 RepID=UPI0011B717EC|nr:VanZ family protein [Planomicrobium sp. CPCC 101079]TWT03567.1 VanZ family protein [Planomicrobium sp. CPCC 101079]
MKNIILLLLLLSILFISSGQTYEQQTLIPTLEKYLAAKPLEGLLSYLHIPYYGTLVSIEERGYFAFIEFLLRKGAHLFMFGAVAIAVVVLMPKPKFWMAFAITVGLAVLDEFHQSLTGGRTPTGQDVLLDSIGAFIALSLWNLYTKISYRPKRREKTVQHH